MFHDQGQIDYLRELNQNGEVDAESVEFLLDDVQRLLDRESSNMLLNIRDAAQTLMSCFAALETKHWFWLKLALEGGPEQLSFYNKFVEVLNNKIDQEENNAE